MDRTVGWMPPRSSWHRMKSWRAYVALALAVAMLGVFGDPQPALAAAYDPSTDPYSMDNAADFSGASAWWDAGYTGAGIDIALIDTGVSPVPGLDGAGKVTHVSDMPTAADLLQMR